MAAPPQAKPDEVFNGDIDLTEDEVLEEDKGEEAEVDDSADLTRNVRIIAMSTAEKNMMDLLLSEEARKRRKRVVIPLREDVQCEDSIVIMRGFYLSIPFGKRVVK